jgi:hypothetical protein
MGKHQVYASEPPPPQRLRRTCAIYFTGVIKALLAIVALLAGGWMIIDGVHVLICGKYIGPEKPGPWSALFSRLGVNPFHLGPLFIVLGALWLACLAATLLGYTWGRWAAAVVAVASLWYLPLGTMLSLAYLGLLYFAKF